MIGALPDHDSFVGVGAAERLGLHAGVDAIEHQEVRLRGVHGDLQPRHARAGLHDFRLVAALGRLPGRKFIHTNGNAEYAWKVLDRLGIAAVVDHLHDIFAADLTPKPELHGYHKLLDQFGIDPAQAVMVEDMVRNLAPAKQLGMTTVWVDNGSERGNHGYDEAIVDVRVSDVGLWLEEILGDDE